MDRAEVWQVVRDKVVGLGAADADAVQEDAALADVLPDSLATVELVLDLEEALGIELPESEMAGVTSVSDLFDLAMRKVRA